MRITHTGYNLSVNYAYAREYIPFMQKLALSERETFQHCSKCDLPYLTSREYKRTDLCGVCSGHLASADMVKHEKRLDYLKKHAKEKRDLR